MFDFTNVTQFNSTQLKITEFGTIEVNDYDLIKEYCTNLNNHLIRIFVIFFIFYIIMEIVNSLHIKFKNNKILKKLNNTISKSYLAAQGLMYVYFVYVWLSQKGMMVYIKKFSFTLWMILIFLFARLFYKKYKEHRTKKMKRNI